MLKKTDDSLSQILGYNLKRAYMVFVEDFRATDALNDVSPRMFTALSLIAKNKGVTQSGLAKILGIERSGMVQIVDALQGQGLVNRVPVQTDRRKYALEVTGDGVKKLSTYQKAIMEHESKLLADFSDQEREQFLAFLHRVQRKQRV